MPETAVFETQVVMLLTQRAPTSTVTPSMTPTITNTPEPTATPLVTATVIKNPYVFQDECYTDPDACVGYKIKNTVPDAWINVTLTFSRTGDEKLFSVPAKTLSTITLLPGEYKAVYSTYCKGVYRAITYVWGISDRTDEFYCSTGLHEFRLR